MTPRSFVLQDHNDMFSDDGTLTPDPDMIEESPIHIGIQRLTSQSKGVPVENLRKMRYGLLCLTFFCMNPPKDIFQPHSSN